MAMHSTNYTNTAGVRFAIEVDRLLVPPNATYWRYSFLVQEQSKGLRIEFLGLIPKTTAATQGLADVFVLANPLESVRHDLLDDYADCTTPLYLPDFANEQYIIA